MSEYKLRHSGAELDDAISKVQKGYILPTGNKEITDNDVYDVTEYAGVIVYVSNLTKRASGTLTLSSDIYGVQTSYDTSGLKIDIGFVPKFFVFRQLDNPTGSITGAKDSAYNIILNSISYFDDFVVTDGANQDLTKLKFTEFLKPAGSGATLSINNTGFYLNPDNPEEVYFYVNSSSYKIRAGSWFWEAYA